ncbi:uncharacterized protein Z518_05603 [Rhinocladiella mackenziei CBS 650.93]|uniref:Amino acid permease/ SLC12A domain-containing protein n=1 Tax=Rhinocladiella mackenziei CBS 650.93 TaxID=1442369 RepID=A0A0D2H2S4_9EURO|nr:uncharacterized protein Z518_05603 [Rhinocladiella mackenziei CBS 650.93]KIX04733.1 hypothetical protein Z518_05603 [Rhinocladiella mackenziei CBS 650.93]
MTTRLQCNPSSNESLPWDWPSPSPTPGLDICNFGQNLIYGGSQVVIFGLIVAFAAQFIITLGLKKTKRFAAFVIGWMSILAWWIVTSSGLSLAAVSVCWVARLFHPSYEIQSYHVWLAFVAVAFITILPLFFAPSKISVTVQATLFLSILGVLLAFIITLATRQQTQPASWIVQDRLGTSGWSDGTAWLLGVTNAMYAFGGTDGVIHISEEMAQPGRRVPQVMSGTMFIGLLTTLSLFLVLMFCMNDLDAVISSSLPSLEIVYQATGSKAATAFVIIWIVAIYILAISSQWVTSGRIAWAFARDGGVPFSHYFSKVDARFGFPVRTTIAAFLFCCCYGLLFLASTTAFNSIVTAAVLFLNITYAVPQAIVLFNGRSKSLPPRYLKTGILLQRVLHVMDHSLGYNDLLPTSPARLGGSDELYKPHYRRTLRADYSLLVHSRKDIPGSSYPMGFDSVCQ